MKTWSIIFIIALVLFPPVRSLTGTALSITGNTIATVGNSIR
ncbi:MAG: hypothetical protein VW908_05865 [Flavobacteriaceae bacterium]